jgi:TonB family protein
MERHQSMPDFDLPRRSSRPIWLMAAFGAVAVHAAGLTLALGSMHADEAVDLGAPAIEIGVELQGPHFDPTDLPVGPDSEAAAASPAVVEQKAVTQQSELPKAVPTETDDPDRAVAPDDTKKPKEDDPKIATIQAEASTQSVAAEATALPSVPHAIEAPHSVGPAPGTAEGARRDRVTWQKELAAHFNKYKRYPQDRVMQKAEVLVNFVLDRSGHVLSTRVVKGSGDTSFDAAALAMLQRSDPMPPPPALVADDGLSFTLPVIFHVKGRE